MGGNTEEAKHYEKLFPSYETISFDFKSENPWDAQSEFSSFFDKIEKKYDEIILIAVSIGAYFSISSLSNRKIKKAFFISPIVDMKYVIENMMKEANITENELIEKMRSSYQALRYCQTNIINLQKNRKLNGMLPASLFTVTGIISQAVKL